MLDAQTKSHQLDIPQGLQCIGLTWLDIIEMVIVLSHWTEIGPYMALQDQFELVLQQER